MEDTDHRTGELVDAFLGDRGIQEPERVAEAIRRGRLYREAGADCVYPIGVRRRDDIAALVSELACPVNGNVGEELDLAALRELGVARSAPVVSGDSR
ncbi:isocitrate lyase/phosphoenolpyruvate mutase family protein [Amycolatopsis coloradensis]|uniref:Isocitrate lyase/phosphoenolpyruvate mutase family protein n=1 Tax=Amycolatopsis coloradensis TaxID=76021 RepID=A0ACD5BGX7_9PSEU